MKQILYFTSTNDLDSYIAELVEQLDGPCSFKHEAINQESLQNISKLSIIHFKSLLKLESKAFSVQGFLNQPRPVPTFLLVSPGELSQDWSLGDQFLLLDQTRPTHFHLPLLKMMMNQKSTNNNESIGQGLDTLVAQSLRELQRVKKLHESLVPLRMEKLKSISLASKFAAGEASGGEFYDVIRSDRQVVVLLSYADSYLATSLILSHFEALKSDQNLSKETLVKFIKTLAQDIRQIDVEKKNDIQLFLLKIDLNSLNTEGFLFGQNQMVSAAKGTPHSNNFPFDASFCEQAYFSHKLERGEKYCVLSPGIIKNTGGLFDGVECARFVMERFESDPTTILNEIFYQLKRGRTEMFLNFDATAIIIEVNSNVIVQI